MDSKTAKQFQSPKEINILAALIVLMFVFILKNKNYAGQLNTETLLQQFAYLALLAIGETFVIITGGIDLSVGSILALSGLLVALLMTPQAVGFSESLGLPPFAAVLAVLVFTGLIGALHGFYVAKLRVPPFVITLGTLGIARGIAAVLTKGTRVPVPEPFAAFGSTSIGGIVPITALITFLIAATAYAILKYSALGRAIYAVGGNIEAARLSGVNIDRTRLFAYCASAILAGLAGVFITAMQNAGDPTVGVGYELIAIASVVIGGTSLAGGEGTMLGTLIGAAIMVALPNGLVVSIGMSPYYQPIVIGAAVVLAVTIDSIRRSKKK